MIIWKLQTKQRLGLSNKDSRIRFWNTWSIALELPYLLRDNASFVLVSIANLLISLRQLRRQSEWLRHTNRSVGQTQNWANLLPKFTVEHTLVARCSVGWSKAELFTEMLSVWTSKALGEEGGTCSVPSLPRLDLSSSTFASSVSHRHKSRMSFRLDWALLSAWLSYTKIRSIINTSNM